MHSKRTTCYFIFLFALLLAIPMAVEPAEDLFTQGVAHLNAGRLDRAIEAFSRSIEMIPHDYEAYNNRGIAYSHKGDPRLAEIDFSKALEINPNFYNAYLNRGIAHQKQGHYSSALSDYTNAHRLKPDNQRPRLLIARILATCPDVRLQDGALAIEMIQGLSGNRASTKRLSLLAAAHAAAGDFKTAIALQKKNLSTLYTVRADPHQVELQQRHLALYQSGRSLQESAPTSQDLSDQEARRIITLLTQLFYKPEVVIQPTVALATKERKLISELPPIKRADPSDLPLPKIPPQEPAVDLTRKEPTVAVKTPSERKTVLSEDTLPVDAPPEPPHKIAQGTIQLSSLSWVFPHRKSTSDPVRFPYVLVIGSFENIENALPALEKLQHNGESFFTSWVTSRSGRKRYQIYNGWYPDKTSAATAALSLIKKYQFQTILVRKAPFTLWIKTNTIYPTLASTRQYLNEMEITPYQIGNRLLVGAYRIERIDAISVIDELTAAGLSFQLIAR